MRHILSLIICSFECVYLLIIDFKNEHSSFEAIKRSLRTKWKKEVKQFYGTGKYERHLIRNDQY